ncbi:MAG: hypothetical protein OEU99_11785, partial [Nitrospira sp.]|nr:hypothetical protein [Nitrospira sp.]
MFEVIGTLGWREGVEECADFVPEGVDGSGGGAYSAESGHRFRANPATPRSPATQGLSARPSVADFRPIWLTV